MTMTIMEESYDLKQIPSPDTRQAVVIATFRDATGTRQGIGAAAHCGQSDKYDPQTLIDKAICQAKERARCSGAPCSNPTMSTDISSPQPSVRPPAKEGERKHRTAPGSASDKQLRLLNEMASEKNRELPSLSQSKFGVSPHQLSSKQANDLIQELRSGQ